MEKHTIQYNGVKHEIIEPTIEMWGKLMTLQDWTDESEFALLLISEMTGLSKEEISGSFTHMNKVPILLQQLMMTTSLMIVGEMI